MNRFAISPVPPSNVPVVILQNSIFICFEELFPYDGEYIFKAMADNSVKYTLIMNQYFNLEDSREDQM